MTLLLTPEAEADLEDTYRWYLGKGPGLGDDFLRAFATCVSSLEHYPEAYPLVYRHYRRAVLRRFPYNVFYAPEGDVIYIHAVFHGKRSPRAWQRRTSVK